MSGNMPDPDGSEIRVLYAILRLDNGGFRFEVMSKSYIDAYATRYSKAFI